MARQMLNGSDFRRLHVWLFVGWTLLALVVLWQYDPVQRKLDADASFMVYAGQQILRGHAPYVSVGIVKLPVSPLVAALGIAAGRGFGVDDILAARIAFWLCAGLTVGAVYLLGAQILNPLGFFRFGESAKPPRVLMGSFAAVVLLSMQALGVQVAEGPEAKLPMVCAGMFCLVLLAREKFFWAGIAGALSFMAWQPGLIFVAAALVGSMVARDRKRTLVQTVTGIALPLVLIGAYLAWNGALASMFRQAFGANANYLGEKKVAVGILGVLVGNVSKVWEVSLACSFTEAPLIVLGYVGMLGGAVFLMWKMARTRDAQTFLSAFPVVLSGAALFGFSLLDLQACSDAVPLLPFLALGAGAVFVAIFVVISRALKMRPRLARALGIVMLLLFAVYGTRDAFAQSRQTGLEQQRELVNELAARIGTADRVQQFGDTVFLVMTGRENATRFVHLGEKQGLGILTAEGVSMDALVDQLRSANPRVITLSRAKDKEWARPLYAWIEAHYNLGTSYGASEGGTRKDTDVWWRKMSEAAQ